MSTPTHLSHKPITSIDNYAQHDGIYKNNTDVRALSIGIAQYDSEQISAKVWRFVNNAWSRQSEELPLHRVIDLNTTILKSILLSANVASPKTNLDVSIINKDELDCILKYYQDNRDILLPKLQELQIMLNFFNQIEPSL